MIQHWHVKVYSGQPVSQEDGVHPLADWLVESESEPPDRDLQEAAESLKIASRGSLTFHRRLMNHTGEFPGRMRFENQSIKVWVFP